MNEKPEKKGTEVAVRGPFDFAPTSFKEAEEQAKVIADSDLVPKDFKGKPGNVLVAMQMGQELGLKPLQAMQNLAIINGRPCVWGDAIHGILLGSGKIEWINESDIAEVRKTGTAWCEIKRKGFPHALRKTFSVQDAKDAGLWTKQGPWKQYPYTMLQRRANAFAARAVGPDLLKGVGIAEEVRDIIDVTPESTPPVERASAPKSGKAAATEGKPAEGGTPPAEEANGLKLARFKVKNSTRKVLDIDGKEVPCALIYPDAEGAPRYYAVDLAIGKLAKKAKEEGRELEVYFDETDAGLRIEEARIPETANA